MTTTAGRFGQHVSQGAASFRCAACGEIAAVVTALPAGCPADMGPPLGMQSQDRDGIVVDYFGGTAWKAAGPPVYQAVREILAAQAPDPAALRQTGRELAPFFCPDCASSYCRADWHPRARFDGSFYHRTTGRCPLGHEHTIDD